MVKIDTVPYTKIVKIDTVPYTKIIKIDTVPYTKIVKIDTLPDGTSPVPKIYIVSPPPGDNNPSLLQ